MRFRRAFGLLFVFVLLLFSGCVHKLRADYHVAETAVWQENCAEIRLPLPEGWAWRYIAQPEGSYFGIRFWPENTPEVSCELTFLPGPSLRCLVSEHPEPFELQNGLRGTCWPYQQSCGLDIENTPGAYCAEIRSSFSDPDDYTRWEPAFFTILSRAELGGDWLWEEEARAIACAAAGPEWTCGYGDYDWLDGSWTFHADPSTGDRWRVCADGTAECLGPPES